MSLPNGEIPRPADQQALVPLTNQQGDFIHRRLRRSADQFRSFVWPAVSNFFGPGTLTPVEGVDEAIAMMLDFLGIDYLFHPAGEEPYGISARVQAPALNGHPWDSFTMSIHQYRRFQRAGEAPFGRLLPALVVQAFIDRRDHQTKSVLLSVGITRVRDLVATSPTGQREGPTGSFVFWSFDELATLGRLAVRIPEPDLLRPFAS